MPTEQEIKSLGWDSLSQWEAFGSPRNADGSPMSFNDAWSQPSVDTSTPETSTDDDKPSKSSAKLFYAAQQVTYDDLVRWYGKYEADLIVADSRVLSENDQSRVDQLKGSSGEPEQAAGITPPSFTGGAGLAERIVQGERGEWYVVNRAGDKLAGPISTKEAAENELENINLGITRPATANAPGDTGGSSSDGTGGSGEPALTLEQQQAQNRAERDAIEEQRQQVMRDYAASNPNYVLEGDTLYDTQTGFAYQASYSKQYGYELQQVQSNPEAVRSRYQQPSGGSDAPNLQDTAAAQGGLQTMIADYQQRTGRTDHVPSFGELVAFYDQKEGPGRSSIGLNPDPTRARNLAAYEATGKLYTPAARDKAGSPNAETFSTRAQALEDVYGRGLPRLDPFERTLFDAGYKFNPETGNPLVNAGVDNETGETVYRELTGSEVQFAAQEAGAPPDLNFVSLAQDKGYRVVANPNPPPPFIVIGPDGKQLGSFDSQSEAQARAGLYAYRAETAGFAQQPERVSLSTARNAPRGPRNNPNLTPTVSRPASNRPVLNPAPPEPPTQPPQQQPDALIYQPPYSTTPSSASTLRLEPKKKRRVLQETRV